MRVHLLVPAAYDEEPSGGNVYDRRLRDGLRARGWEVVVHELERGGVVVPEGVLLVDSLVTSCAAPYLLPVADRVVPLVHMVFGTPGERELLAAAPVVVTTSEWLRRMLRLATARVARPGADPVPPRTRIPGRELLCVGPVTRDKGHDVLVDALARLRDVDWRCTVVGPLDREPAFVDGVRKAVADAGVADRVRLLGPLPHEAVGSAYAAADVLVHPSRQESYGMVVAEAMAHGLDVVASDVGGVAEAAGGAAVLVPPDDPAALAGALRRWLDGTRPAVTRPEPTDWADTAAVVAAALEEVR